MVTIKKYIHKNIKEQIKTGKCFVPFSSNSFLLSPTQKCMKYNINMQNYHFTCFYMGAKLGLLPCIKNIVGGAREHGAEENIWSCH
jgi:hypothetical protein